MDAVSLAEDIVKKAVKKGCDKAEVFIKTSKNLSVEAKDCQVEALETSRDFGMSLKIIKKQRLGFSFTTRPGGIDTYNRAVAEELINDAVKGAECTEADEYVDIPNPPLPPFNKGGLGGITPSDVLVLDERIEKLKEEDIIENSLLLEKTALDFDKRIRKVRKAGIALNIGKTIIFNSKGVNISYESGYLTALVNALASDGQDSQMGWDFAASRRLSDIDFVSIARAASKRAIDLLGARKISAVKIPVILNPSVATDFLGILSASISAEAVQKKRSFLAGKVNKSITSPLINITDDGLMPWGLGTKPVDDEGVATKKKGIVSSGILTGFIHNTYTAKREGVTSTGNAARGSFKSLAGIDTTNFYIQPRKSQGSEVRGQEEKDLIRSVSKGILILEAMGVHTADPISGDFSIGISGLWIERGEIAYPVKEAVISGNILELFKRVEKVGGNLKFYGKTGSPSLLIGEMNISA